MPERYAVYILASQRNGALYIGVTGDLPRRINPGWRELSPDLG